MGPGDQTTGWTFKLVCSVQSSGVKLLAEVDANNGASDTLIASNTNNPNTLTCDGTTQNTVNLGNIGTGLTSGSYWLKLKLSTNVAGKTITMTVGSNTFVNDGISVPEYALLLVLLVPLVPKRARNTLLRRKVK